MYKRKCSMAGHTPNVTTHTVRTRHSQDPNHYHQSLMFRDLSHVMEEGFLVGVVVFLICDAGKRSDWGANQQLQT